MCDNKKWFLRSKNQILDCSKTSYLFLSKSEFLISQNQILNIERDFLILEYNTHVKLRSIFGYHKMIFWGQVSDLIDLSEVRKAHYHSVEQCPNYLFIYSSCIRVSGVWGGGSSHSSNFHMKTCFLHLLILCIK